MKTKSIFCKSCGNDHIIYKVPTSFLLNIIGIEKHWCHKCEQTSLSWSLQPNHYYS